MSHSHKESAGEKFESRYESGVNGGVSSTAETLIIQNQMNDYAKGCSPESKKNFVNDYNAAVTQSISDRKNGSDPSEGLPLSRATISKDGSITIAPTNDFGNR